MKLAFLLLLSTFAGTAAAPATRAIRVDQAGYLPKAPKIAFVAPTEALSDFTLRRAGDNAAVFHGRLSASVFDPDSGDHIQAADFSSYTTPGTYYLEVPKLGQSWHFAISPSVYTRVFYLAMRSFYGQRCGTAVDLGSEFPGYRHKACHLDGQFHASSGRTGKHPNDGKGWHDAGDYGRYVVNSGITTGTLLWAYELFHDRIAKTRLDIPESGNGTPDILNEIRWNLDWMLSMQDTDGGVWHKQTSTHFSGFVLPERDTLTSYIIGTGSEPFKSACATADFAAVMAIAARLYKPFDNTFADRAREAARSAYTWVTQHPAVTFQNPPGISTGAYADNNCADEHLWAAAELARTTHDADPTNYFAAHAAQFLNATAPDNPPSWSNVAALALWTYALSGAHDALATQIREASQHAADTLVTRTEHAPYRMSLLSKDYTWGSNSNAANYGLELLIANALHPDPRYVDAAAGNLHYLLGSNAFSLSFVTRVGENPFRHPHHRPSVAIGLVEPWPGLLSGGPNSGKQDPELAKMPDGPPARMYLDSAGSFASNEVAINWNAPLVFLLAGLLPE